MSEEKIVVLKNGIKAHEATVIMTMLCLQKLLKDNPVAFYEFVQICVNPEHESFGNTASVIRQSGLITPEGVVHDETRRITLSAVEGKGVEMRLTNPLKTPDTDSDSDQ